IDRVISEYLDKKENYSDQKLSLAKVDKEINPTHIYAVDWIKFAFDGAHTGLFLDLSPSKDGKYGQIIFIDEEYEIGILVARSTTELIETLKNDLESDLYYLDKEALADENHYLTTDPKIDIVNWETSERWRRYKDFLMKLHVYDDDGF